MNSLRSISLFNRVPFYITKFHFALSGLWKYDALGTFLLDWTGRTALVNNFPESWNPGMLWVGRDLKNFFVPTPAHAAQTSFQPALELVGILWEFSKNSLSRISINSVLIDLNIPVSAANAKIFHFTSLLKCRKWNQFISVSYETFGIIFFF